MDLPRFIPAPVFRFRAEPSPIFPIEVPEAREVVLQPEVFDQLFGFPDTEPAPL